MLNPILCLEGKITNLKNLPQIGRQDKKHSEMLIWCVREFLKTICQQSSPRTGLKLVERIWRLSLRDAGLSAWYIHNINVESAVPIELLTQLDDDKWQLFCSTRLPQLENQLESKRIRYQTIEEQLIERRRNLKNSD